MEEMSTWKSCSNHAASTGYSGTWMEHRPPPKWKGIFLQEVTFSVSTFQNYLCPAVLQGVKEITIKFPHHKIKHGYYCVGANWISGFQVKNRFLKVSAELELRDKDESLGLATKPL